MNIETIRQQVIDSDIISKQIIRDSLRYGFRDDNDVRIFLKYGIKKITVGTKVNCGKNHHTQFQFLSDVLTNKVNDFIVWANRGGSKSFLGGLIAWCKAGQSRTDISILGGSGEQSEKSFKAMNEFFDCSGIGQELLEKPPLLSETEWKNKSLVNILTASQRSVRGGHPVILLLDEIDEMDFDIYEAALQMPQSKYDLPSITGMYSTNHRRGGTMDNALERITSGESEVALYKWCIWECLESCKDYSCSTCPLSRFCPGKHMKQADGYYKIADFVKKLNVLSEYTLSVEWFCDKLGSGDLIYGHEFDPDKHVIDYDFNKNLYVYLSIDWGGTHPFSLGFWQDVPEIGWVRFDEIYLGNITNRRLIDEAKKKWWWKQATVVAGVGDPSRPDLIREWDELAGIKINKADNEVDEGIEAVKNALAPVIGKPKFYISKRCVNTIAEFQSYSLKNGHIVKENDHAMDDTRYFVRWKIAKKTDTDGYVVTCDRDVSPSD